MLALPAVGGQWANQTAGGRPCGSDFGRSPVFGGCLAARGPAGSWCCAVVLARLQEANVPLKLQEEISQLKESQFQFESKNLDLLHEKKRVRSFEKQLLAKNWLLVKSHAN